MAYSKKTVRYSGELKKPIVPQFVRPQGLRVTDPDTVARANEEMVRLEIEAIHRARVEKLPLLMNYYGIADATDYFSLSLCLAAEHVPGFSAKQSLWRVPYGYRGWVGPVLKPGRRSWWTNDRLSKLCHDVEEIKRLQSITENRAALKILARRKAWKPPANHRGSNLQWLETLESRLHDAKRFQRDVDKLREMFDEILSAAFRK